MAETQEYGQDSNTDFHTTTGNWQLPGIATELRIHIISPLGSGDEGEIILSEGVGHVRLSTRKYGEGGYAIVRMTPQQLQQIGEVMAMLGKTWSQDA